MVKCPTCNKRPPAPKRYRCAACSEKQRQGMERLTQKRREEGRCLHCGKPPLPGHPDCRSCMDKAAERVRRKRQQLKAEAIAAYGGICVCCQEDGLVFLTLDHIEGGGPAHRKEVTGNNPPRFYAVLRKQGYPQGDLQVMCFNCNIAKYQLGTCPHQL